MNEGDELIQFSFYSGEWKLLKFSVNDKIQLSVYASEEILCFT